MITEDYFDFDLCGDATTTPETHNELPSPESTTSATGSPTRTAPSVQPSRLLSLALNGNLRRTRGGSVTAQASSSAPPPQVSEEASAHVSTPTHDTNRIEAFNESAAGQRSPQTHSSEGRTVTEGEPPRPTRPPPQPGSRTSRQRKRHPPEEHSQGLLSLDQAAGGDPPPQVPEQVPASSTADTRGPRAHTVEERVDPEAGSSQAPSTSSREIVVHPNTRPPRKEGSRSSRTGRR